MRNNYDVTPLLRQWIGFDKLAHALESDPGSPAFPPYNIEKNDDNHYRITLALAGFRQEDLAILQEGTKLNLKGTPVKPEKEPTWLHEGLTTQPFNLSFILAEHMKVVSATFHHGLLHIDLFREIPEAATVQRIEISERPALNS